MSVTATPVMLMLEASRVSTSRVVIVAYVPTSDVIIPAVILALTMSPSVAEIVVIVAAVPTISVTANPVILTSLASNVSISTVETVA